jgi:DNA-binding LacI/PurR family transcriptional regulator
MASIRDVAREAGVSPATVSRTFTTPTLINDDTRSRVLAAARLLDYRPPHLRNNHHVTTEADPEIGFARRRHPLFKGDTSDAIGFQFFHSTPGDSLLSNVFYAPVLAGAQAEAEALGLHILLHSTDTNAIKEGLPRMVTEGAVRGILLVGVPGSDVLQQLANRIPALVLVDNPGAEGPFERVLSDGFAGGYIAAQHVLGQGHRRLGFFLAESETVTFRDRLHGWLCGQFDAGILPDPTLVVSGENDDIRRERLYALLSLPDRPTVLMAANDHYAVGVLQFCREIGLRVPQDLSLVGFDDVRFSAVTDPPLTTLRIDTTLMGRLAVRRLYAQIQALTGGPAPEAAQTRQISADPSCASGIRHVVPVSLLTRGSTAPPGEAR